MRRVPHRILVLVSLLVATDAINGARYDSEQTLAAFGERVRAEVDLAALSDAVLATADEAVRPAAAGLWLRGAAE